MQRENWVSFQNLNGEHFSWLNSVLGSRDSYTIFHLKVSRPNVLVMLTVMDDANIAANDPKPQQRSLLPSTAPP